MRYFSTHLAKEACCASAQNLLYVRSYSVALFHTNQFRLVENMSKTFGMISFCATIGATMAWRTFALSKRNMASLTTTVKLSDLRKEYSKKGLVEESIPKNPIALFRDWFDEAVAAKVLEPNAMCLSTCVDNKPSGRFVLLKFFDEKGFVWFTNYSSRKGSELDVNPNASITFWWGELERSVRIEGRVEKTSGSESDSYFEKRPRGSRLGAWSSNQSQPIANREELERQEKEIEQKYSGMEQIPRPEHWGGYRLIPHRIEFWKGRECRLHDRIAFLKQSDDTWEMTRLQP